MHNREITHIVKTDSSPKPQLVSKHVCCQLRETYVKTKKKPQSFMKTQCKS